MELREHAEELALECIKRPDSFALWHDDDREWFKPGAWGFSPIGTHRDADTLTRSNWTVITTSLLQRYPSSFEVIHTSHWAVGWYDHLAVDTSDGAAMEALAKWCCALSAYPVANEEHWSELEFAEACAYWTRMSVSDRVDALQRSGSSCSVFVARRDSLPCDDNGGLQQYLNSP